MFPTASHSDGMSFLMSQWLSHRVVERIKCNEKLIRKEKSLTYSHFVFVKCHRHRQRCYLQCYYQLHCLHHHHPHHQRHHHQHHPLLPLIYMICECHWFSVTKITTMVLVLMWCYVGLSGLSKGLTILDSGDFPRAKTLLYFINIQLGTIASHVSHMTFFRGRVSCSVFCLMKLAMTPYTLSSPSWPSLASFIPKWIQLQAIQQINTFIFKFLLKFTSNW